MNIYLYVQVSISINYVTLSAAKSLSLDEQILCEKQIKGWLRSKKIELIETDNKEWEDLSQGWYDE